MADLAHDRYRPSTYERKDLTGRGWTEAMIRAPLSRPDAVVEFSRSCMRPLFGRVRDVGAHAEREGGGDEPANSAERVSSRVPSGSTNTVSGSYSPCSALTACHATSLPVAW